MGGHRALSRSIAKPSLGMVFNRLLLLNIMYSMRWRSRLHSRLLVRLLLLLLIYNLRRGRRGTSLLWYSIFLMLSFAEGAVHS